MTTPKIKNVVVLVGSRDFGRCPLASRLSPALWPVDGTPAVERLLDHLAEQGIKNVALCYYGDGDSEAFDRIAGKKRPINLAIIHEQLPLGTAGSSRDARKALHLKDELVAIMPAGMVSLPDMAEIARVHEQNNDTMTVFFNQGGPNGNITGDCSGIYVCNGSVFDHVPAAGYSDIKEGLIPQLLRSGKTVKCAKLSHKVEAFGNMKQYLAATKRILVQKDQQDQRLVSPSADIHPEAVLVGPVSIMPGANIEKDAVIIGPSVISSDAVIKSDAVVVNSIVWPGAAIGERSRVDNSVIGYEAQVPADRTVESTAVFGTPAFSKRLSFVKREDPSMNNKSRKQKTAKAAPIPQANESSSAGLWAGIAAVAAAFFWSYSSGLAELWSWWQKSDEYSVGLLVPLLAAYILWSRRNRFSDIEIKPSIITGCILLALGQAVRFFGTYNGYGSLELYSIGISIIALIVLLGGIEFAVRNWGVMLFLFLMFPLPRRVESMIAEPLQRWATISSVFSLEILGYDVAREGNIIHLGDTSVAVAEACNGLRMITAFIIISVLVILLTKRQWWEKIFVLASCLPIAIFCNTVRLTVTAIAFTFIEQEAWQQKFHDFGGYAMMPLALGIVVGELWLLSRLAIDPEQERAANKAGKKNKQDIITRSHKKTA